MNNILELRIKRRPAKRVSLVTMVSASLAVQWWDQWQLRVLVLGSLCIQYLLFVAAAFRKYCTRAWFRSLIWLAYLGSDAITVYALAILFSLHKKVEWATAHPGSIGLDVLWSAILLLHLGGRDDIVAYSLEDNQLWKRHLLTAVSQVSERAFFFFAQRLISSRAIHDLSFWFYHQVLYHSKRSIITRPRNNFSTAGQNPFVGVLRNRP